MTIVHWHHFFAEGTPLQVSSSAGVATVAGAEAMHEPPGGFMSVEPQEPTGNVRVDVSIAACKISIIV